MTAIIYDIMDIITIRDADDLNDNEKEILMYVALAHQMAKAAATYPQGRENYMRACRQKLEKALIYLDEELEDERES